MATKTFDPGEMENAAREANSELRPDMTILEVSLWWKKWYMKAGHKRLGRLLVSLTPKT